MKKKILSAVLGAAMLLGWSHSAFALGTSHFFQPAASFTCTQAGCTKVTTGDIGLTGNKPVLTMANLATATARSEFWFPPSHVSSSVAFTAVVHAITSVSGQQKHCWAVAASFLKDVTTGTATWGNILGSEGTAGTGSLDANLGASYGYKYTVPISSFDGYDFAGATTCTYAICNSQPGQLFVQRLVGGSCSGGSSSTTHLLGIDVKWDIP
jgi:hypothetical protein